jgi:hypothetical protein
MRHNQIIKLINVIVTEDAIGNQIASTTERAVYANEYYVSQSEFYNAAVAGLKPEKQFEMYSYEYQDEPKLEHDGVTYNIIRTEKRGDKIRLTCERIIADETGSAKLVDHKLVQDLKALVEEILADEDVTMEPETKEAYQAALTDILEGW